ncbi:hypothetical protein CRI69_25340 [Escherichia sp. E4742]|nr:hypothetical protein CRI69_25340 [Escherichia sp. E4742]
MEKNDKVHLMEEKAYRFGKTLKKTSAMGMGNNSAHYYDYSIQYTLFIYFISAFLMVFVVCIYTN